MKHFIRTLTAATAIVAMTACAGSSEELETGNQPEDNKTPITVGKLTVAGDVLPSSRGGAQRAEGSTRTVGNWGDTYDPFNQGDELTVTKAATSVIYQYQADGTWNIKEGETPFYKEDFADNDVFTAAKGTEDLVEDQSTLADYRSADHITGNLQLSGNQFINKTDETLTHQHVDVVVTITPAAGSTHWDGKDFVTHMQATTVTFHTKNETAIKPFCATITPQAVTYRAVMPAASMPTAGTEKIVTITAPKDQTLEVKYTLENGATPEAGKRLTITIDYDNKRTLTAKATVTPWTNGPDYTAQHNGYDMIIRTADDLWAFAKLVNGGLYGLTAIQVADIDLEKKEWTPIGTKDDPYTGTYNGGGYTISGLNVDGSSNESQGLFDCIVIPAILTGINLKDPTVTGEAFIGALVGQAGINTHVNNCSVQGGKITGKNTIGGLIGSNFGATTVACYATDVTVEATQSNGDAGGLAGVNVSGGTIYFCYAKAKSVTGGTSNTGALVGTNGGVNNNGYIYSCYATIPTDSQAQALVGEDYNNSTAPANCNSIDPATAGATVRAYTGAPITAKTSFNTSRPVDASIWGPGKQPTLNW